MRPDRRLSVGLNLKTLVWVGPERPQDIQSHFDDIFQRSCELSGRVFLQAPDEEIEARVSERMKQPGNYVGLGSMGVTGHKCFRRILTPGQYQRFEKYKREQKEKCGLDGTFFCDVDHWPESPGPSSGPMFPVLLRRGTVLELDSGKVVMNSDRWLSLGFDVLGVGQNRWPLSDVVLGMPLPQAEKASAEEAPLPAPAVNPNQMVFAGQSAQDSPWDPLSNASGEADGH